LQSNTDQVGRQPAAICSHRGRLLDAQERIPTGAGEGRGAIAGGQSSYSISIVREGTGTVPCARYFPVFHTGVLYPRVSEADLPDYYCRLSAGARPKARLNKLLNGWNRPLPAGPRSWPKV